MPHNVDLASTKEERKQDLLFLGSKGTTWNKAQKAPCPSPHINSRHLQLLLHAPLPCCQLCPAAARLRPLLLLHPAPSHIDCSHTAATATEYKTTFIKKVRGRIESKRESYGSVAMMRIDRKRSTRIIALACHPSFQAVSANLCIPPFFCHKAFSAKRYFFRVTYCSNLV